VTAGEDSLLSGTVIAVSAFRSDGSVLQLLERIFQEGGREAAAVIVVDSLNDAGLGEAIRSRGWPVHYENAPVNLGSAGNLARRLQLAAGVSGADWCFALNHDGMFRRELVEQLVATGRSADRVGAVFPRRIMTNRGGTVLRPHRHVFATPRFGDDAGQAPPREVAWDSSNGALYALHPVREGLLPWADLWMGWEDLAFGWLLGSRGWKQLHCADADYLDDYEYARVSLLGRELFITRKPPWYAYYAIRNLLLIIRRASGGTAAWRFVAERLGRELLFTLLFRTDKLRRLRYLLRGLIDGLRGITGQARGVH
jgi:GT2 family glycosyltransferase